MGIDLVSFQAAKYSVLPLVFQLVNKQREWDCLDSVTGPLCLHVHTPLEPTVPTLITSINITKKVTWSSWWQAYFSSFIGVFFSACGLVLQVWSKLAVELPLRLSTAFPLLGPFYTHQVSYLVVFLDFLLNGKTIGACVAALFSNVLVIIFCQYNLI